MKRIYKVFILSVIVIILTGCMKINASFKVLENGNYNFYMTLLLSENAYNNINLDVDTLKDIIIDETGLNTDNIKEFSKNIDGVKYLGYEIRYNHKSADNIENINVQLSEDRKEITFSIDKPSIGDEFINLDALGSGKDALKVLKDNGMGIIIRIEMPGAIKYSSKGTIDNDIVTIDLLDEELTDVTVISKVNRSYFPMMVMMIAVASSMYLYHHYRYRKKV